MSDKCEDYKKSEEYIEDLKEDIRVLEDELYKTRVENRELEQRNIILENELRKIKMVINNG